jgi:hypothetical protein
MADQGTQYLELPGVELQQPAGPEQVVQDVAGIIPFL